MRVLYLYEAHRERQVPLVPPPFETDRTLTETRRSALDLSRISVDYTNNQVSKSSLSAFGNDVNKEFTSALPANPYPKTTWTPQTNNTTKNIVP